jgi:hypothetical protein
LEKIKTAVRALRTAVPLLLLYERKAGGFRFAFAHYRDAVGNAFSVFIENAVRAAGNARIYRVIGFDKFVSRLEKRFSLVFVGRVSSAVGIFVYADFLAAAAITLVVFTAFKPAF